MKTQIVKVILGDLKAPWVWQYTIDSWGNPAGEIYDLKNGQFLALANSCSTGYSRKVFKTTKSARKWIESKIQEQFSICKLEYTIA